MILKDIKSYCVGSWLTSNPKVLAMKEVEVVAPLWCSVQTQLLILPPLVLNLMNVHLSLCTDLWWFCDSDHLPLKAVFVFPCVLILGLFVFRSILHASLLCFACQGIEQAPKSTNLPGLSFWERNTDERFLGGSKEGGEAKAPLPASCSISGSSCIFSAHLIGSAYSLHPAHRGWHLFAFTNQNGLPVSRPLSSSISSITSSQCEGPTVVNIQWFLFPEWRWLRSQAKNHHLPKLSLFFIHFRCIFFSIFFITSFWCRGLHKMFALPLLKNILDLREKWELTGGTAALWSLHNNSYLTVCILSFTFPTQQGTHFWWGHTHPGYDVILHIVLQTGLIIHCGILKPEMECSGPEAKLQDPSGRHVSQRPREA